MMDDNNANNNKPGKQVDRARNMFERFTARNDEIDFVSRTRCRVLLLQRIDFKVQLGARYRQYYRTNHLAQVLS
jgi:hypothetical protein